MHLNSLLVPNLSAGVLTASAGAGRPAGLARGCSRPRHHRASVRVALLGASPDPAGGSVDLGHDARVVVEQVW